MDGYEGDDLFWRCTDGNWIAQSSSTCKPMWLKYTGDCTIPLEKTNVKDANDCLKACGAKSNCDAYKFEVSLNN